MASRAFKDINLSFKRHPVTNDVLTVSDEDAIKKSVKNIVFTILGEKPFQPNFGSAVNESLFDLNTTLNEVRVTDEIKAALALYEPRIGNVSATVSIYPDSNEMNATVQYDICLLYTSPSPRDVRSSRMPSSA